jgi:hypothetical protein
MTTPKKLNRTVLLNVIASANDRLRPLEDAIVAEAAREQKLAALKADHMAAQADRYKSLGGR